MGSASSKRHRQETDRMRKEAEDQRVRFESEMREMRNKMDKMCDELATLKGAERLDRQPTQDAATSMTIQKTSPLNKKKSKTRSSTRSNTNNSTETQVYI